MAALGFGVALPTKSDAEQPARAAQCSASRERGRISAYTSTTARSRIFRTVLLEADRYLQVTMPNAYMGEVSQAASARPEAERPAFVADIMQKNVSAAMTALGTGRRANFDCAPATATAPPATAQPAAPQPSPAPTTVQPPQPSPAPAPTQDGGAEQPAGRRRVIQPGTVPAPAPSGKASAPKQGESASAVQAPIPPLRKGGKGTDAEPYVIEVPVPSKRAAGSELYREKFSYTYTGAAVSQKIYIALRFVAASGTTVTSKSQLVGQITPLASILMRQALSEKNVNDAPSSGSLVGSVGMIVNHAKKENAEVNAYAADS